jgi:hypothetical protein
LTAVQRQVEEQRTLPGLADGFQPQLTLALGSGMWLGSQQSGRVQLTAGSALSQT